MVACQVYIYVRNCTREYYLWFWICAKTCDSCREKPLDSRTGHLALDNAWVAPGTTRIHTFPHVDLKAERLNCIWLDFLHLNTSSGQFACFPCRLSGKAFTVPQASRHLGQHFTFRQNENVYWGTSEIRKGAMGSLRELEAFGRKSNFPCDPSMN